MSLLDDVSIVVTPNGYKAGELYAVIPVPSEGSELVVNGSFADSGSWGGSGSIAGGQLTKTGSGLAYQTGVITSGKQYKIVVDVASLDGATNIYAGGNNSANLTVGVQTIYMAGGSSNAFIGLNNGYTSSSGSVFNSISVKEFTASDMDVTRATAATRVDENGLVNYAEVLGSEIIQNVDFSSDTWWLKSSANVNISNGKGNYTAGTTEYFYKPNILTVGKQYKLVYEITNYTTGYISALAGNWSVLQTVVGTYEIYFTCIDDDFGLVGNIFVGSIDNVSVKEVTRDNVPRIDYTGGGCPHILAEPQRTNLVTSSEDFTTDWSKDDVTISANSITSPAGTLTADKIIGNTVSSRHNILDSGLTNSVTASISVFAKAGELRYLQIASANTANQYANFDLLAGAIGNVGSDFSSVQITSLKNDWYRITLVTLNQYNNFYILLVSGLTASWLESWSMSNNTDGLYLWGAQLEEGSYPTSYIPTSGSSVTRNQDIFTRDGIGSLINSTEGVLFVEMAALENVNDDERTVSLSDGTNVNTIRLQFNTLNNNVRVFVGNGVTQVNSNITISDITVFNKFAFKYKQNDFALWINGSEVITDTSGNTFAAGTLNKLGFVRGDNTEYLFGKVKQLQVFKTALTDSELATLTT